MKKKPSAIIWLSVVVIVFPFFGVPLVAKQWILVIAGLAIGALAFLIRTEGEDRGKKSNGVYTENNPVDVSRVSGDTSSQ